MDCDKQIVITTTIDVEVRDKQAPSDDKDIDPILEE